MAPSEPSSDSSSARSLSLPELIFSCGICQATVSEVYATPETNKGFHSGSGDDGSIVTRLWIAECSHVSCGKHLAGGAAPFHPKGEQPQAPCPQCIQTGDKTLKNLYGIRGLDEGEHDSSIPRTWFQCPPIRLDGSAPGMDAVRFQFMALARCSQKVHTRWKTAEEKHVNVAQALGRERKQREELQHELSEARLKTIDDAAALAKAQTSLKKWEDRVPVINSLMASIKPMSDDLRQMRSTLTELGFHIPKRDYGDVQENAEMNIGDRDPRQDDPMRGMSPVNEVAHGLVPWRCTETDAPPVVRAINGSSSSSSRKRKRGGQQEGDHGLRRGTQRTSSRDLMPPPPVQMKQRLEQPSQTAQPQEMLVSQYRATSEGIPKVPAFQFPIIENEVHGLPIDFRIQEAVRSPVGSHPAAFKQPYAQYEYHSNDLIDHESRDVYNTDHHGLASSFGENDGSVINQPTYVSQPTGRPTLQRNNNFPNVKNRDVQQDQLWDTRQPLRPIDVNGWGARTSAHSYYRQANLVSTPRTAREPNAGSVSSPFFQCNIGSVHDSPTRPPPARGGDAREKHTRQESRLTASLNSQWMYEKQGASNAQDRFRSSRQLQPSSHDGQSESAPFTTTLPYRNFTATSQAPNYLRPRLDSRAYVPSLQQPAAERPHFPESRGRITLPPSQSSTRDYELSRIRGLRGGYPHQAEGFTVHRDPDYAGSRPLFSASSRRSVRR